MKRFARHRKRLEDFEGEEIMTRKTTREIRHKGETNARQAVEGTNGAVESERMPSFPEELEEQVLKR